MHNSGAQLKFPSDLLKTAMFRWHITLSILTTELHTAASRQYNNNIAPETTTNNHIITKDDIGKSLCTKKRTILQL